MHSSTTTNATNPDVVDPAYVEYRNGNYEKALSLLASMKESADNPSEVRRLEANMKLCECRMNGVLYSKEYYDALLELYPNLKTPVNQDVVNSRSEGFVAFNLAVNAVIRGHQKSAVDLLHCILKNNEVLPNRLFIAASLLEIEMSLMFNQPKLALKLVSKLHENTAVWREANTMQKEYLDCLKQRIGCRLRQVESSPDDESSNANKFYRCILQSEANVRNGKNHQAFNCLRDFNASLSNNEQRLLDNAFGCVYALSFKKPSAAEVYFRSSMLTSKSQDGSDQESLIPRRCLIYHTALAQLQSNKPESAFHLFQSVLPFYSHQPRIWLRLAECCIYSLAKPSASQKATHVDYSNEIVLHTLGRGLHTQIALNTTSSNKTTIGLYASDSSGTATISWSYASSCVRNALLLSSTDKDYEYMLPWLHIASAFININLGRAGLVLSAARHLCNLAQASSYHKYLAVLYKTEALLLLDRIEEAQICLDKAIPLQSIPLTASALMYNRALLQSYAENYSKSYAIYSLMNVGHSTPFSNQVVLLGIYLNMRLGKYAEARRLVEEHIGRKFVI
uniref:CCR4-NOT transcription complex subunit 10 n=1 Tax=Syphacia muris TaxID=451379 RepID=A0A0N5A8Z0_9BILA